MFMFIYFVILFHSATIKMDATQARKLCKFIIIFQLVYLI